MFHAFFLDKKSVFPSMSGILPLLALPSKPPRAPAYYLAGILFSWGSSLGKGNFGEFHLLINLSMKPDSLLPWCRNDSFISLADILTTARRLGSPLKIENM